MVIVLLKIWCKEHVCKTLIQVVYIQYPLKSVKLHNIEYLKLSICNTVRMKVENESNFDEELATVINGFCTLIIQQSHYWKHI